MHDYRLEYAPYRIFMEIGLIVKSNKPKTEMTVMLLQTNEKWERTAQLSLPESDCSTVTGIQNTQYTGFYSLKSVFNRHIIINHSEFQAILLERIHADAK